MSINLIKKFQLVYDNDVDALIPEKWAKWGLTVLLSNIVIGNHIHRDFENEVADFGDIVNTRRPNDFTAKRKVTGEDVTIQDANVSNIQVALNQHPEVSFILYDSEVSKSMDDLVDLFIDGAGKAIVEFIDSVIHCQYVHWLRRDFAGALGGMTALNAHQYILAARRILNDQKAPAMGRYMHLPPRMEEVMLSDKTFLEADKVGDGGLAVEEASLGRKLGFSMFMGQNAPSIQGNFATATFQINNAAGYSIGDTVLTVDTGATTLTVGQWLTINGHPYQIAAVTGSPTTQITLAVGLRANASDNDTITVYTPGAVNNASGYAAGYHKYIKFDGFTGSNPVKGQAVTFGTHSGSQIYGIVEVDTTNNLIKLDRPLQAAIADNDAVNIGPVGEYTLGLTRNALMLVCRPLALPKAGAGALAAVANAEGFAIRAVISYDGRKQGHLVTLDCLMGIAVLDERLGALLLG